jgi:aminoglycoside/choline kinase family phosphotransferase
LTDRDKILEAFVDRAGWRGARITPLAQDASFRRYLRLEQPGQSALVMDAPPQFEDTRPFIQVSEHLKQLGVRCAEIYFSDIENGFLLIEDLGDSTFTRLLASGENESVLYQQAIEVLVNLHNNHNAAKVDVPAYNIDRSIEESLLFIDWYLPSVQQQPGSEEMHAGFADALTAAHDALPVLEQTLVLRDYHIDNLMLVDGECAVLDYQDALVGSPAYDVVSLVEDARRDIPGHIREAALETYLAGRPGLDRAAFFRHIAFWGIQRHLKVAGIFTRLWRRDNKSQYLEHVPRVMQLVEGKLQDPGLHAIATWFKKYNVATSQNE